MEKLITAAWWPNWQVDNGFIVFGSVCRLVRWQEKG